MIAISGMTHHYFLTGKAARGAKARK